MTILSADVAARPGPRYRALADAIADAIADGRLAVGTRLPPQRELATTLGVTVGTVGRAYDVAAQRQLVSAQVGRGTFVAEPPEGPLTHDVMTGREMSPVDPGYPAMDLRTNQPVIDCHAELAAAASEIADGAADPALFLGYPPTVGHRVDLLAGAAWLARHGVDCDPDDVMVTAGAQGALAVAVTALSRPGDVLLACGLSYPHFHDLGGLLGLRRHAVEADDQGICPDALDVACRDTGGRLLVLNPTLHNPTGGTLTPERRRAIVAVARAHDLILVEDDVYGLLLPDPPEPIRNLAPERTIYLTSISKTLAPGLRLGFLVAPPALRARLVDAQHTMLLGLPPLAARLFRHWLDSGLADRVVDHQRSETEARQVLARRVLGPLAPNARTEGHHLWLRVPGRWRASALVDRLRAADVHVLAGDLFAFGRARVPNAIRLALSGAVDRASLERAMEILVRTVEQDARGHEVCA
ncbi:MAG: PLP-dependent aminotransferase family protein [Pseudomonadota bacterium]